MLRRIKRTIKTALLKKWGFDTEEIIRFKAVECLRSASYYGELHDLLHISQTNGRELVRIGRENDGGYIMLNDFASGGIAYSFGISSDVSWDKDMAARGYDVFMYDHTIDALPEENPRFHWSKLGIADGTTQDDRLKALDELIRINRHEAKRNMILKMDVEGAEWGFLERVSQETLRQFSQMTFEFHRMLNPDKPDLVLDIFRKLNQTHQLIHLHANNNGSYISFGGRNFCTVIEASYVLREGHTFNDDYDVSLPLSLDSPNAKRIEEIELGRWNEPVQPSERLVFHMWRK